MSTVCIVCIHFALVSWISPSHWNSAEGHGARLWKCRCLGRWLFSVAVSIQWREYQGPDSQWMTWMTDARRWSLLLWQIREWLPSILWWWFYCQEGNNGAFLSYLEILGEQHWRSCFTGGLRSNDHVHNFRNAFGWCCSRLSVDVKSWDKMTSIGSDQGGAVLDYSEFTQPDPKSCV